MARIVTSEEKARMYNNAHDRVKIAQEHKEKLKELGLDRLVPVKGQSLEKVSSDLKENFNEIKENFSMKKEVNDKEKEQRNKELRAKKLKELVKNFDKNREAREKREYEARRIKL